MHKIVAFSFFFYHEFKDTGVLPVMLPQTTVNSWSAVISGHILSENNKAAMMSS